MLLEKSAQRPLQLAGAVAVNQPDGPLIGQQRLVEEPLRARDRFVHAAADHVQIRRRRLARLQLDIDLDAGRRRGRPGPRRRSDRARWRASVCRARQPPRRRREGRSPRLPARSRRRSRDRRPWAGVRCVAGFAAGVWVVRASQQPRRRPDRPRRAHRRAPRPCRRSSRRARRRASWAMAVVFAFRSAMTSSISRRAWRTWVSSSSFRRRRNVSSRWRSASSRWRIRPPAASSSSRSRAASRCSCSSRAHVAIDLGQVVRELRLPRAQVLRARG